MEKLLVLLNDACYGSERSYNGLRLATALAVKPDTEVRLFLMGDAVTCAKSGQRTAPGYYNVEQMLQRLAERGVEVGG